MWEGHLGPKGFAAGRRSHNFVGGTVGAILLGWDRGHGPLPLHGPLPQVIGGTVGAPHGRDFYWVGIAGMARSHNMAHSRK